MPKKTDDNGNEIEEGAEGTPTNDETTLPEWAQKELKRARNEAGSYRTQLRETQDALGKTKSPEEYEALSTNFKQTLAARERELAAAKFDLPPELAKRVTGGTYDEMLADAKELSAHVRSASEDDGREPNPPANLKGGLDPKGTPGDSRFDPKALADEILAGTGGITFF